MPEQADQKSANLPSASEVIAQRTARTTFQSGGEVISGISLRFEAGKVPKLTEQAAGRVALDATIFADLKKRGEQIKSEQSTPEQALKLAAAEKRGLRGVDSQLGNFRLGLKPSRSIEWNLEQLKADLGVNYGDVVHERLAANVALPLGMETDEGPLTADLIQEALRRGLATLGISKSDAEAMIRTEITPVVDEDELAKQLAAEQVTLSENAAEVTETWSITVDPLKKS